MRCWYIRWKLSNALDEGDLASRLGRGHAAHCASCQAFGHALEVLDARLSRGADTAAVPVVAVRRTRWPLLVAGPLAVAGAAAIALAIGSGAAPVAPPVDVRPPTLQASESIVQVRRVADKVSQFLAKTPLETELDALLYDSRRGLDAVLATGSLR